MEDASADVVGQVPDLALDKLGYEGGCHLDSVILNNGRGMKWVHSSVEAQWLLLDVVGVRVEKCWLRLSLSPRVLGFLQLWRGAGSIYERRDCLPRDPLL
jgi:hypothetical protein